VGLCNLKSRNVVILADLNADLKHYFSVRHSVARLELSASTSEVIRHAGAIQIRLLLLLLLLLYFKIIKQYLVTIDRHEL